MLSSSPSSRNARPGAARSLDWVSGRTDLTGAALRRSLDDATVGWLRALWADAARLLPGGRGDDGGPDGHRGVSLVGVGGTGRGDRAPGSDLDLVVVFDAEATCAPPAEMLEALWYTIWDSGIPLGHSVRNIDEFIALAGDDLSTATSLFSLRHLAGDQAVTRRLEERAAWQRDTLGGLWLRRLVERTDARHRNVGDVAHELEPDLKEGRGGLRDVHTLGWMQALGVELPDEVDLLIEAGSEVLWSVRAELHRVTGRPGNVLVLQEQVAVAERLGYNTPEELARGVSVAAREVSWVIDDLWPELTGHRRRVPADDVVLRDDPDLIAEVVRSGDRVLLLEQAQCSDLTSVLRLGVVAAERGLRLRRDTLVGLVDLAPIPEPWSTQARRLFCRLVASGPSSVRVVEALDRVGLWARILPEWEAVRCAPQRNPYHRFTVDRHLLECAAIAAGLSGRVDRPDLLVLGALFHDLGKGRPGDHSEVGAQLARGAMERMGFPKRETDGVVAMVTHHLLMPEVATRRDLDDPATIAMVTDQVGSVGEVRMLAALAEADGRATGSTAWGPWKASLVRTLADRTIARLAGIEAIEDASQGTLSDDPEVKGLLETCAPVLRGEGDRLVVCMPDRPGLFARVAGVLALRNARILTASASCSGGWAVQMFRIRTPSGEAPRWGRIVDDLSAALDARLAIRARLAERLQSERHRAWPGTMVQPTVRFDEGTGVTVIEVAAADRTGLAFSLASALTELDCTIVKATLTTLGPNAVDTFSITDTEGAPVVDPARRHALRQALVDAAVH
ncbi:[protein-PII] uridylyltransferase [Candidatus Microthrix parvicella]|uniref:[protein-PII] uridylyltransferase n=1 Tax=Candidatus Neomicrothrix parvicella TaxID=41950 RepID=UPI0012FDECC7|nr:[protein-PII] uridylyltransferase [Candidatus Microthrix parvicella]